MIAVLEKLNAHLEDYLTENGVRYVNAPTKKILIEYGVVVIIVN